MITISAINGISGVRHAFFTRDGGVSDGPFRALNCGFGSGDDPDNVTRNRAIALEKLELGDAELVTAYQKHTADVTIVTEPWQPADAPVADALVTALEGIALGILSADCAPVLLADPRARVVGAAHAGWRGALSGVTDAAVDAMTKLGADPARIIAAIGPCIAQRSYEVGEDFAETFVADDPDNAMFFRPARREGHRMFDLSGYISRRLNRSGVRRVIRAPGDTCLESARFFSYRRMVLEGGQEYGRGLSVIALSDGS
jgi:YfiH family protein